MASATDLYDLLAANLPAERIVASDLEAADPWIQLDPAAWQSAAELLATHEALYFDLCESLAGVDLGPKENRMGVVVHLSSIPHGHRLVLKCFVDRHPLDEEGNPDASLPELPSIPSLSGIWRAADWHEREAYDLFGILFEGHPDLRRMFLPPDWEGFPLRKDYSTPEEYHSIQVDY